LTPVRRQVNHRQLLDGFFSVCGIKATKFKTICSTIDKLDKISWADARKEMIEEKGLAPEVADKLEPLVRVRGASFD